MGDGDVEEIRAVVDTGPLIHLGDIDALFLLSAVDELVVPRMVLRNVEATVGAYSLTITGEATNESERDYSYVQLQFGVYDESGAKTDDALANTSGLDAGRTWRFEAMGTETENVDTFDIGDVTAY